MSTYFRVRTPNGYVGARSLAGPLTDTQSRAFAYTYESAEEAATVAESFGGTVEKN